MPISLKELPKLIIITLVSVSLLIITSLIDRHGPPVTNWRFSDESPYRHARGIPIEYLQRSLPDGVCQVNDPHCELQAHQLNIIYLIIDLAFWATLTIAIFKGVRQLGKK